MKVRIKTAIIFGLIIFILLFPGYARPYFSVILLFLIGLFASKEMTEAFANINFKLNARLLRLSYLSFIPSFVYLFWHKSELITAKMLVDNGGAKNINLSINQDLLFGAILFYLIFQILILTYMIFKPLLQKGANILPEIAAQILTSLYISLPLFAGLLLPFLLPAGWFWFVLAIITPWISDSSAYFLGRKWGKKPIVPNLSPNKTYAGFIGSIIGTIIFYLPIFYLAAKYLFVISFKPIYWLYIILFGGALGILTELGDWLASAIKRYCDIKDFSNLLPGHGGVIDRFDSTFFSFTAILTIALLFYFF